MPQGDGHEKLAGLINSMERLKKVFDGISDSSKKVKENIKEHDSSLDLKKAIESATTSPVLFKKLSEVLSRNLGGKATPEIRENLAKASQYRKEYMGARKDYARIDKEVDALKASRPLAKNAAALAALNAKITEKETQRADTGIDIVKYKNLMSVGLERTRKAALGAGSALESIVNPISHLGKAAGFAGVALQAAPKIIDFFDQKLKESAFIIQRYSHFSIGGMHSAQLMYVRDLQRNIYASRSLSGSMYEFARANSDMKDSWKGINIVLDKLTLALGTVGSRLAQGVGMILDPVAKGFDKMMGGLRRNEAWAASIATGMLGVGGALGLKALADVSNWKDQDEQMKDTREKIARRKAFFARRPVQLKPGDIDRLEMVFNRLPPGRNPGQIAGMQGPGGRAAQRHQAAIAAVQAGQAGKPAKGLGQGGAVPPPPIPGAVANPNMKQAIGADLVARMADAEKRIKMANDASERANEEANVARIRKAQLKNDQIQEKAEQQKKFDEASKREEDEWNKSQKAREDLKKIEIEKKLFDMQANIGWRTYDKDWVKPLPTGGYDLMRT
jgi:hypothetical protein